MKISKNNYSPNDRFLIKIFIKIISLDSSQRVPPMSPCPPLIITTVCPWLINHLSDPWDFNKSNGILLRSNWRKPYPKFYGSELLIIKGWSRKLARRYLPLPTWGGGLINPMLAPWTIIIKAYQCCAFIFASAHRDLQSFWAAATDVATQHPMQPEINCELLCPN